MNTNMGINLALNRLYQKQIVTREYLTNEMVRVKLTHRKLRLSNKTINDKEKLFQFIQKITEDNLGFFPTDRDDFCDIYEDLGELLYFLIKEIKCRRR